MENIVHIMAYAATLKLEGYEADIIVEPYDYQKDGYYVAISTNKPESMYDNVSWFIDRDGQVLSLKFTK